MSDETADQRSRDGSVGGVLGVDLKSVGPDPSGASRNWKRLLPAGHPPPTPARLDDIGVAHVIDGDGTAMCQPNLKLDQVSDYMWSDVPADQRCSLCVANVGA